ncbi:zinc finger protein 665-like isoform X3 [Metopolophium dirhodum]|uniref:zinc finger protein 665-like isoform X3 n=1 Tax=Metopolophium dirhodum TaxID=44670 RepID=UPI00298FBEDC|nr:zinc finger protein 665-like isoform X3 [Metopolophium dirhodum]
MDDQLDIMLENSNEEFITLSYADHSLISHPEQLSDECADMILDQDNCQNMSDMAPLNDLLLGQTFLIETNEQPLFVDGAELITFQHIDSNEQINDIETISNNIESDKSTVENIDFTINSDDQFQEICTDFNKTTNDSNNLTEHLQVKINTDITSGNYSYSTAIKILDDVAKSPVDTNGHFVCDLCLHEFYNWKHYKKHKLEHLNDKPFKCLKCLKSFNYNNNYLLHIASHSTSNLKCPKCKKEFKRYASFKAHLKIHKTEELITCSICDKIFDNQYRLDIHKENCIQENLMNPGEETSVGCTICNMSFSTVSEYKMHNKEHRKFDSVLKKYHKLATKFKRLHKTANKVKKFKCDHCDWSFNKSNLLRRHMRTHTGEKPFECTDCSVYFTQQNSLNRHLMKHKGIRPFRCEFCEMSFCQKGHLINHMKKCHAVKKEPTRIHKCSMCSCVYNSINALSRHLNIFHGVKTRNVHKKVKNKVTKSVETVDENKHSNKDSSKLKQWLEEVAHELKSGDNNTELKNCNDPISTQCDFGLNLIESKHYDHILSPISNIASDHTEIENLTYTLADGDNYIIVVKKKQEQPSIKNAVVQNQEKELVTTVTENESISLNVVKETAKMEKELVTTVTENESISLNVVKETAKKGMEPITTATENESIPLSVVEETTTTKKLPSRKKKCGNKMSKLDAKKILPRKKNVSSLNLKKRNCIGDEIKRNINLPSSKAEPKVVYVPNIATNSEERTISITEKPLPKVCQFCEKIFKKNADLERHERTHTGDRPYKCDDQDCNKAFATKSSLEYHKITHSGQMKRAECPQCNGLFATTSTLKVHMRQHTGEKPFKCPVCGDAFRTTGHLHTHVIIHERKKKRK